MIEEIKRLNKVVDKLEQRISTLEQTGNVDQKETREIKLEQLGNMVMAMEIFVLLIVRTIGGQKMEQAQLTTQEDYINL
jgi:uncharacterized protein YaaN involved in tellurite resistance